MMIRKALLWVIEQLPASSTTLLNGQMDIDDAGGTTFDQSLR